eukprot:TRINITY_DN13806_c0_g1_i1.p1 TRINITY_DN13806_c0_g1~~TRINITY_DN13806_c0_g1_i1.p1  ORF type:complete len:143 (-),score=50.35 TRINITY_DN13806_c0_g1_i1:44-424(-)
MMNNSGVNSKDVLSYGYSLADKIFGIKSTLQAVILAEGVKALTALSASSTTVASLAASATVPIAAIGAQLALFSTPLFFIGLIGLAKTGIELTFGSTEGRLLIPTIMILNQRLLLGIEGINIDQYY